MQVKFSAALVSHFAVIVFLEDNTYVDYFQKHIL